MKRAIRNYVTFVALSILGLLEAVSGFVLWFALPSGGGGVAAGVEAASGVAQNIPSGHYPGIPGLIFMIGRR